MLLKLQNSQENISAGVFSWSCRTQASSLIFYYKRDWKEIKKEHLFYRTAADDCFRIQNINCHEVSALELIISKSYREARRRGRSKLLLHTNINYHRCTLVKGLNHVIKSFTQLLTVHGFAQNIHIFILQKVSWTNDNIVSLSWCFDESAKWRALHALRAWRAHVLGVLTCLLCFMKWHVWCASSNWCAWYAL